MTEDEDDDDAPLTLIQCPVCLEPGRNGCPWCFGTGQIDARTLVIWEQWREVQRKQSSTHNMLRGMCEDVIALLKQSARPGAQVMRLEGVLQVATWEGSDEANKEACAAAVRDWHGRALRFLTS